MSKSSDGERDLFGDQPPGPTDRDGDTSDPEVASGSTGKGDSKAERLFREARKLEGEGDLHGALARYREVVAIAPAHLRARNNLGVAHDRLGAHESALEHFRAALEVDPENPEVLSNLGAALGALGRFDQAERELRRAMRIDPSRTDIRANLGILYFRRGLYEKAEHELRWVCEQDPEHGPAHVYRGEALNRLGRVDEALDTLERASRLQPDNPRIYYVMGVLYDRKHLPAEAAVMYRRSREVEGRS